MLLALAGQLVLKAEGVDAGIGGDRTLGGVTGDVVVVVVDDVEAIGGVVVVAALAFDLELWPLRTLPPWPTVLLSLLLLLTVGSFCC
jgi:hypothetical protein